MTHVVLPHGGWRPRPYQMPAWAALEGGANRVALAWHRRAGKDELCLHWAAVCAMQRVGVYWHMLPQQNQARRAIWDAVNPRTGRRRIDDAFPREIIDTIRNDEMFIRFKNGSTWQVVGSDNYNALVGAPPVGVVMSEYALADPNAWGFLSPILAENGGWALFISTPRGNNHFARMMEYARGNPDWFAQTLAVTDTNAIRMEAVEEDRREKSALLGEMEANALIRQEYYCDFNAAIPGAYFGEHMTRAEREGRIDVYAHDPSLPVGTAWDLGHNDSTVIWFYQQPRSGRVRLIDVYESSGVGIDHYTQKLAQRPYNYADHIWPHDGRHGNIRDVGGNNLVTTAKRLGMKSPRVLDRDHSKLVGINAARQILPLCEFNTEPIPFPDESRSDAKQRMVRALDALKQYRRVFNEKLQRYDDHPLHDWTSNTADALRYLARGRKPFLTAQAIANRRRRAITD